MKRLSPMEKKQLHMGIITDNTRLVMASQCSIYAKVYETNYKKMVSWNTEEAELFRRKKEEMYEWKCIFLEALEVDFIDEQKLEDGESLFFKFYEGISVSCHVPIPRERYEEEVYLYLKSFPEKYRILPDKIARPPMKKYIKGDFAKGNSDVKSEEENRQLYNKDDIRKFLNIAMKDNKRMAA